MAHLKVINFGAIKSADIEIKNIIFLSVIHQVERVQLQSLSQYSTILYFGLSKKETLKHSPTY